MIPMSLDQWNAIKRAIEIMQMTPDVKKIEGKGWKVYAMGTVIRIDIDDV